MYTQLALLVSLAVLIFFIYKLSTLSPPVVILTSLEYFNKRKQNVLNILNEFKLKLNDVQFPPITCKSIDKNYEIEELDNLKQSDPKKLEDLVNCGYVHNLYLVVLFEEWIKLSKTHSDSSFENFLYLCVRPPSDILSVNFTTLKSSTSACIEKNNVNITYPYIQ
jgi:hypothetical protein